jgi:predicted alpha/beta superfamily hydrolase
MNSYCLFLICILELSTGYLLRPEAQVALGKNAKEAARPAAIPSEVSILNTKKIDFRSKVNGHRYSIAIALPFTPAPKEGYGVLYVLDSYWTFATATQAARGPANVIVVGIGYPDDPAYAERVLAERGPLPDTFRSMPPLFSFPFFEREYDLTLPTSDMELAAENYPGFPRPRRQNYGGLDDFLKTIETEVKPRVSTVVSIDKKNQALSGGSLGGLATLRALLTEPNAFRTFIICSPSIWVGNGSVLASLDRFAATVEAGHATPRVLVTVGSNESTPPKSSPEDVASYYRRTRMVENAAELVAKLKSLHGKPGYQVADLVVFDKADHGEAGLPGLMRGIRFAFGDDK